MQNQNQNTQNDVESEFYKRFLSLFASYYDVPSTDPILSFPSSPSAQNKDDGKSKPKSSLSQPLNSCIWDVRLKKAVDKYQSELNEVNEKIDQQIEKDIKTLTNHSDENDSHEDLTDVFLPEKVARPEVPKYMQTFENEKRREEEQRTLSKTNRIDNNFALTQFNIRLKKQKQRSMEWKRRFQEKQREDERKHQEFLATLPKTERSGDKPSAMTIRQSIKEQKKFAKTLYAKRIEEGYKITKSNFEQFMPQKPNSDNSEIAEEEEDN